MIRTLAFLVALAPTAALAHPGAHAHPHGLEALAVAAAALLVLGTWAARRWR